MSLDSDESDILADIQALDKVLSQNATNDRSTDNPSIGSSSPSSENGSCDSDDDDDDSYYINSNSNVDKFQNAFEINKQLIRGLMIAKKKVTALLKECEKKIERLDEKLKITTDDLTDHCKLLLTTAGMPYFKNKNCFSAPKNYDTKLKESRGELFLLDLMKKPCRWSEKDRKMLITTIETEAKCIVLGQSVDDIGKKEPSKLSDLITKMEAMGEKEFDWYKIAATDFEDKHSANECRCMWNMYLHPDFYRKGWTSMEDNQLLQYVRIHNYQNWDAITARLGTKRSAYQCFIRYNTIKKTPFIGRSWTKVEDQQLVRVMNRLKIGNYIPWAEIASYMNYRTKQQVYTRWVYGKAPHLTKGRFTRAETDTLMMAIKKHGMNFPKISRTLMPQRSAIQLYSRYQTIIDGKSKNTWSFDYDTKLLSLQSKHGNNWSKIAKDFPSKSRTQVRHRYNALMKFIDKGHSLHEIHRKTTLNMNVSTTKISLFNQSENYTRDKLQISDILPRLLDILRYPPSSNSTNFQVSYDYAQLAYETNQFYNTLNMLNVDFDIQDDFFSYAHISKHQRKLLTALKNYIEYRKNYEKNDEMIEEYRSLMFGPVPQVDENSRFIPPLPFDGYMRRKKPKNTKLINCNLDLTNKFLIDVPTKMVTPSDINSFLIGTEEVQFSKFSQLLIGNDYQCDEDENLCESSERQFSKIQLKLCRHETKKELSNRNLQGTSRTEYINNDTDETKDIFKDLVMPNHPTLLGLKNLLVWKLLYEWQDKSTTAYQPLEMKDYEYQKAYHMLKHRLLQMFKLPIGLSTAILHLQGPQDSIFLTDEDEVEQKKSPPKRKPRSKWRLDLSVNNDDSQDINVETANHRAKCNSEIPCKRRKIAK